MNANQIINMVIRMVMRRLMRGGVNAGINAASKKFGRGRGDTGAQDQGGQGPSTGPDGKATEKRARQAMRVNRRFGKF